MELPQTLNPKPYPGGGPADAEPARPARAAHSPRSLQAAAAFLCLGFRGLGV